MSVQLRAWLGVCVAVAAAIAFGASRLASQPGLPSYEKPASAIATGEALALFVLALASALLAGRFGLDPGRGSPAADPPRVRARPWATLFAISFVALFVELMLIRYVGSQLRIFSFYKNVPLIGCFLGLGLGCCLARANSRHVLLFLFWLVPFAVALSAGSLVVSQALGKLAAQGSAEHILGDYAPVSAVPELSGQLLIAFFCVAVLVVITLLFSLLGRLLGEAFEHVERLPGYTVNILGSLAGILGFVAVSHFETAPPVWFAIGLLPLLWWAPGPREAGAALLWTALCVVAVSPSYGDTVWSQYQKLVGHERSASAHAGQAYLVEISDVFYQVAVDRSAGERRRTGDPLPHYGAIYDALPKPERVLIVGAGTGNDVAAALQAGAAHVDAVDIDSAIVEMGRAHHPERPYDDPRVRVVVDDARRAFRQLPEQSYDIVVFGLLDSHTQLAMSSVRLDNYVFTLESFAEARRLVRPGGHVVITAATFRPWFRDRLHAMLTASVAPPLHEFTHGVWLTLISPVEGPPPALETGKRASAQVLPSDDWPFLYLPERAIPSAYLWVVASLALASLAVLRLGGLRFGSFSSHHAHLFFLGAAFLLMEVHAINRLALLYGTTWQVSAVAIALVLVLIVVANFSVLLFPRLPYALAYAALAASLGVSFWIDPADVLGGGRGAEFAFGLLLLSPVYFAGLIFARSFRVASVAATAIGANILGSVLGGWIEYATMAGGMRSLVLLAAAFYALSALGLTRQTRNSFPHRSNPDSPG